MGADVGERSSHEKEHCRSKASWLRKFFDLPRIQHCYREKALVVIPPVMRICATSNGEQRVQVLIPVMQGLSQKQRHLVQQYFELVDWQGLQLPSAERRQRDSFSKKLNAQSKCGKTRYVLRKNSQHLVKSCLHWNCYQPSTRNRVQIQRRKTQATRSLDEER